MSRPPAGTLRGGEQQMLAIGRGFMGIPVLLMLDEPSLALSSMRSNFALEVIRNIYERLKFSVILVEQRALEDLELGNRCYILKSGRISMSGSREDRMGNPRGQKAYLGALKMDSPKGCRR